MAKTIKPRGLTLRSYQVGFGDCYLLTFHYDSSERHVLIDFGSTGQPKKSGDKLMLRVAQDIKEECGGKLHAIVATHRHKDHISGFATSKNGKGSGDVIASCNPDVVIQPWTEDPKAQPDATKATRVSSDKKLFAQALLNMHTVSASALAEINRLRNQLPKGLVEQVSFLGDDNISNRSAIENLARIGKRHYYVNFGSRTGLETLLPGVRTRVLGPPTLEQSETIKKQRAKDSAEFWHFQANAGEAVISDGEVLFPKAEAYSRTEFLPVHTRWFINRMQNVRASEMLQLVRILDTAMNNTSVILLFEVGKHKLLFPGDAQIENWTYALSRPDVQRLLSSVNLYKVGHHGSLNATPKTLWNLFEHRSTKKGPDRLKTLCSTMPGKHGSEDSKTEVPRRTLVRALKSESDYFTTEELKGPTAIRKDFTIML